MPPDPINPQLMTSPLNSLLQVQNKVSDIPAQALVETVLVVPRRAVRAECLPFVLIKLNVKPRPNRALAFKKSRHRYIRFTTYETASTKSCRFCRRAPGSCPLFR